LLFFCIAFNMRYFDEASVGNENIRMNAYASPSP
jgi:hypothetical protein